MKEQKSFSLPKSKESFKVPESYFENFDDRLFSKRKSSVTETQSKRGKLRELLYYGVAASIILMVGLGFWLGQGSENALNPLDIENYLQATTNASEIVKDFNAADFNAFEESLNLNELKIDEYLLSSTDIEYYLNE